VRRRAARVLGALLLAALFVRLTLRDRFPFVSTLHYATPPAVLALGALAWAALRGGRPALLGLAAALAGFVWQAGVSRFDRAPRAGNLRVVFWNLKNGSRGWDGLAGALAADAPDLIGLVEADGGPRRLPPLLPGYDWAWPGRNLGLAARGRILSSELRELAPGSRAGVIRVELGRPLTVLVVDLASNPLTPRRAAFRELEILLWEFRPDLVMGDFNTPRDSVFFDDWRGPLRHAFEEAGRGWDVTWPLPVPFLPIDHVWCGPRVEPRAAEHPASGASDHRRVRVTAELR
jgi:endonuclease/exonuclease/phosphatase (EEP) superfamily protein YafD